MENRKIAKSQSAMEYLMTYGWALLIIAVVLVAFYQLGIFGGAATSGSRATAGACQIVKTISGSSLQGECQGQLPQYVANFNGKSNITTSAVAQIPMTYNEPFTITMWINIPAYAAPNSIELFYLGGYDDFQIQGTSPTAHRCSAADTGGTTAVPLNIWVFVAESVTNPNYIFVTNGNQVNAVNNNVYPQALTPQTVAIGGVGHCFPANFKGEMANVQLYNTSLSANELQALYLEGIGGAPVRPQNIAAWWPLNGNQNDYSGNNNQGTVSSGGGISFTSQWLGGYQGHSS